MNHDRCGPNPSPPFSRPPPASARPLTSELQHRGSVRRRRRRLRGKMKSQVYGNVDMDRRCARWLPP